MLIFTFAFLFVLILPSVTDGRMDDDTELTNDSFGKDIENLHGDFNKCRIKVNGEMINATAKVNPPFKMPTCLKVSHVPRLIKAKIKNHIFLYI